MCLFHSTGNGLNWCFLNLRTTQKKSTFTFKSFLGFGIPLPQNLTILSHIGPLFKTPIKRRHGRGTFWGDQQGRAKALKIHDPLDGCHQRLPSAALRPRAPHGTSSAWHRPRRGPKDEAFQRQKLHVRSDSLLFLLCVLFRGWLLILMFGM